jgi:hypothetical protein
MPAFSGEMKMRHLWIRPITLTVLLAVLSFVSVCAIAQSKSESVPLLYGGLGPSISLAELSKMAATPTPRTKDGHPDLTGYWGPPPGFAPSGDNYGVTEVSPDGKTTVLGVLNPHQIDQGVGAEARRRDIIKPAKGEANPTYKPEWQDKVDSMRLRDIAFFSPVYHCLPVGVPGLGAPWEIVQTSSTVYFLYGDNDRTDGGRTRIVPIDGRPHNPEAEPRPMGDSIGHWEGDTLVVDVTDLSDFTWFNRTNASIHSDKLHVVERFSRRGNTMQYETTVEDPIALAKPWERIPETVILSPGKHTREDYPCINRGAEHHGLNNDSQGFELDSETLKRLEQLPATDPRVK